MQNTVRPWVVLIKGVTLYAILEIGLFLSGLDAASLNIYHSPALIRERFPFSTAPDAEDKALDVGILDAIFASHVISRPKGEAEYRVLLIGDSATWGAPLPADEALSGQLNAMKLTCGGRRVVVYNLAYPEPSALKDLMIMDRALQSDPDLVIWSVTLLTLVRRNVDEHPLLTTDPEALDTVNARFHILKGPVAARSFPEQFAHDQFALFRSMRYQTYGLIQLATGRDQIQDETLEMGKDLAANVTFLEMNPPILKQSEVTIDLVNVFRALAGDVPVIIENEPIIRIENAPNSDLRYNTYYPRWVYDQYRAYMVKAAAKYDWLYLDFWNLLAPDLFADTPLHLNRAGEEQLALALAPSITAVCSNGAALHQ